MAQASKTLDMSISPSQLLTVIKDYEKYPNFVDGVHSAKILGQFNGATRVAYSIEIMSKSIHYTLDHFDDGAKGIHWSLVESNFMSKNNGAWIIEEKGAKGASVTYNLDLEFTFSVPSLVLSGLLRTSLPAMMKAFEKQAVARG